MTPPKKLLIVSATRMWNSGNEVHAFEPTLREVELLAALFDEITWIGFGQKGNGSANARGDRSGKIKFRMLTGVYGGKSFFQKLRIIPSLAGLVNTIFNECNKAEAIHTRGPSLPALIAIFYSFFSSKVIWHKYAGNWIQENPPLSYGLQRLMLKRQTGHAVTVNGKWPKQPRHIIGFENPAFSNVELDHAKQSAGRKQYGPPWTILFAGRIESEKGIFTVIEALRTLSNGEPKIRKLIVAGEGKDFEKAKALAASLPYRVELKGAVGRSELESLYGESHFLVLPTVASEGFPKVIAEAAAFGCVPVVSAISSIQQYIRHDENGIILSGSSAKILSAALAELFRNKEKVEVMAKKASALGDLFTYERYNQRIDNEILNRA